MDSYHGTTILSVRRGSTVALGGDGQVTLGNIVIKQTARKVRRLYHEKILAGFAGGTADAFTLFERFEAKLAHQRILAEQANPFIGTIDRSALDRVQPADAARVAGVGLTPRAAETLLWLAQGKTNPDIATILTITESTVKKHVQEIFEKLGVETRGAATVRALEVLNGGGVNP